MNSNDEMVQEVLIAKIRRKSVIVYRDIHVHSKKKIKNDAHKFKGTKCARLIAWENAPKWKWKEIKRCKVPNNIQSYPFFVSLGQVTLPETQITSAREKVS